MAEAGALGGALDQPGDVGEHRLALLALDRPQRRRERRERVVGDLRRRPRQPPQQRGLAGVRQPDQADVGEQLQPQLDPVGLAGGAVLGEARRLPGRGGEALVAVAAAPAAGRRPPAGPARPGRSRCRRRRPPGSRPGPGSRGPPRARRAGWRLRRGARAGRGSAWSRAAPRGRACEASQTSTTSPPCPPSPPSGPPRGTCASRRKEMQPLPPAPPSTQIFALSSISQGAYEPRGPNRAAWRSGREGRGGSRQTLNREP